MSTFYDTEREAEAMVYPTYQEAVHAEIVAPIEAGDADALDYDIEAIANAVLSWDRVHCGYCCTVSPTVFWRIVEANAR